MFYLRAAPHFFGVTLGGDFLRVEPRFPSLTGFPAVNNDTQIWSLFGSGGVGALAFSALLSGKRTDLFSDSLYKRSLLSPPKGGSSSEAFSPDGPASSSMSNSSLDAATIPSSRP
jgi:hypothetical protein